MAAAKSRSLKCIRKNPAWDRVGFFWSGRAVACLLRRLRFRGCVVSAVCMFVASLDNLFWFVKEALRLKPECLLLSCSHHAVCQSVPQSLLCDLSFFFPPLRDSRWQTSNWNVREWIRSHNWHKCCWQCEKHKLLKEITGLYVTEYVLILANLNCYLIPF